MAKNVTISKKEYESLKKKASEWDSLDEKVSEFFCDETGEYNPDNPKRKGDLCDIGEVVCNAMGFSI